MKKLLFLLTAFGLAAPAFANPGILTSTAVYTTAGANITTGNINTVGATAIVVFTNTSNSAPFSGISDNQGNTYTGLTRYSGSSYSSQIFYSCGPRTSASHTFTITAHPSFTQNVQIAVATGTATSNCYAVGTDTGALATAFQVKFTFTPSQVGQLLLTQGTSSNQTVFTAFTISPSTFTIAYDDHSTTNAPIGAWAWNVSGNTTGIPVTWAGTFNGLYSGAAAAFNPPSGYVYPPAIINSPLYQ